MPPYWVLFDPIAPEHQMGRRCVTPRLRSRGCARRLESHDGDDPTPLIAPLSIEEVWASAKNVPPPALSVIALLEVIPPSAASASRVPPLKLNGPVPKLLSVFTARMPSLKLVPPL